MFRIVILFLLLASCVTAPHSAEIKDAGGKIYRRCVAEQYVVDVGGEISEMRETATYMYLYEKEDQFYWRIERCEKETGETFFPQSLTIEVYDRKVDAEGDLTYYGTDVKTGERYFIMNLSWDEGLGYFYIVGDEVNQIVYSIPYSNVRFN